MDVSFLFCDCEFIQLIICEQLSATLSHVFVILSPHRQLEITTNWYFLTE